MEPKDDTNLYKPDSTQPSEKTAPKTSSTISWTASEYIEHQRGAGWYLMLILITAVLAASIYFITKDYFAGGTVAVLGIIIGVSVGRKPGQVSFELSATGLKVGEKHYGYNLFKSFSVLHEGHLSSINLAPVKRFMPPVSAYFEPKNEKKIVNLLGERLPYEEKQPSAIDRLSFRLRL